MKNKKIINLGLIKEGIRQTRAMGIAFVAICSLIAFFTANSYINRKILGISYSYTSVAPDSGAMEFICVIGIFMFLPVVCFMMFSFLNSRSASDFYHSIPNSRLSLALNFSLSIAFWFFTAILADMLIEIIVGIICGYTIVITEILLLLLCEIIMFIMVLGIILISVGAATGTINQVVLSLIIAYLPRILILLIGGISESAAPVLMGLDDTLGRFGEYDINLLFGFSGVASSRVMILKNDFVPVIYSFVLALVYFALGLFAFIRRKSEAATAAGANKYVQCAIRVLTAFVVCLLPCFLFSAAFISDAGENDILATLFSLMPVILLIYGFAVVAYFLYEAISTRRLKGVFTLKGTMGIGLIILLVLNLAFIFTPVIGTRIALSADINTGNVESISLVDGDFTEYAYCGYEAEKYEFTDEEIIGILCTGLKENISVIRYSDTEDEYYDYFNYRNIVSVSFNMKDGRILKRNVYLSDRIYNNLNGMFFEDDGFVKVLRQIPEIDKVEHIYCNDVELTYEQCVLLYNTLRNEIDSMSDEEFAAYVFQNDFGDIFDGSEYYPVTDYISVLGSNWYNSFAINKMVPETLALYTELTDYKTY